MRSSRRFRVPARKSICILLLSLGLQATSVKGQVAESSETPYTLHVYEDLVQVPTLVLTSTNASYTGLSSRSFSATFDDGPLAHPNHVRREGDDPVAFAMLLDVSQKRQLELAKGLSGELQRLPADVFTASDRISVFADDCSLIRSLQNVPASLSALSAGITDVLASPTLHRSADEKPRCGGERRLWDVIATTILQLQKSPGRRILFVITDGLDRESTASWQTVKRLALRSGVTVFGIHPARVPILYLNGQLQFASLTEKDFDTFCDGTGGLTFSEESNTLAATLGRVMGFVRNRYILDFQRPSNATAGDHEIDVRVPDSTAIVRVSGAVFPIRDQHLIDDPSTVPSDLSHAPEFGDHKPKQPE